MKIVTASELTNRIGLIQGIPRIVTSGNTATPWEIIAIVDKALPEYTLHALNASGQVPVRDGVVAETCFVGPGMRKHPNLHYVPCRLSMVPLLYMRELRPDVVLVHTTPPRDGHVSLGIEVNVLPAAIDACRATGGLVVAVMNPQMPFTYGDALIPVDDINLAVEVDSPIMSSEPKTPDDISREIGRQVARRVPDGATMQLGIGAVPDATLEGLIQHRGLRVWTEMFSDGVLELSKAHALDENHPLTTTFCFGSQELYKWLDGNKQVRMKRTELVNDPAMIAHQRSMISVNTALQVDLFGQANASRINSRIHSGFGGQTDFIVGAVHSSGGQSIMALRSWHPKANVSTVVPLLTEPVTSFQQSAFITEQGVAELFGRDERSQAQQIIDNIAHPNVRDELRAAAAQMGLG